MSSEGEKRKIRRAFAEIDGNKNAELTSADKLVNKRKPEPSKDQQLSCFDTLEVSSVASEASIDEPSVDDFSILPNEILSEIFLKLGRADQLNFAATCRRMNECFGSVVVLKNFKFRYSFDEEEVRIVQRRYSWVVFEDMYSEPSNVEQKESIERVFQSMGPHIKKLTFENWYEVSQDFVSTALSHFPKVESFTIRDVEVIASPTYQELTFPKLKKLKIDTRHHQPLERILSKISSLETLSHKEISSGDVSDVENEPPRAVEQSSLITDVMMRQPKLKSLQISSGTIFDEKLKLSSFTLNTLVLFIASMTRAQVQNMMDFVEEQKQLKSVTLNVLLEFKSREFNATFAHILRSPALKSLSIVFYNKDSIQFYRKCKIVNPSVERLYLKVAPDQSFRRFIQSSSKIFPNLKQLGLDIDEADSKHLLSKSFTHLNSLWKLETLQLDNFRTRLMKTLAFAQLKTLNLSRLQQFDKEEYNVFLSNNKSLVNVDVLLGEPRSPEEASAVQLVESTILHSRRIQHIVICTCQHFIPDDAVENIRALVKEVSSPIQSLKVCSQTVNF